MALYKAPTENYVSTTLNGSINDAVTTITLNDASALQFPGVVVIDREDGNGTATAGSREVVQYTGISGNQLTGCTRGASSSGAKSHNDGALVEATFTVSMWNDLRDVVATVTDDGSDIHTSNATISAVAHTAQLAVTSTASIAQLNVADIPSLAVSSIASVAESHLATAYLTTGYLTSVASTAVAEFGMGNSGGHIVLTPGASKFTKTTVLEQSTAGADSYKNNAIFLTGTSVVTIASGQEKGVTTISYGVTFSANPVVFVTVAENDSTFASSDERPHAQVNSVTDTDYAGISLITRLGNVAAARAVKVSWLAIGQLN